MRQTANIALFSVCLLAGCQQDDDQPLFYKTIEFDGFRLSAPTAWQPFSRTPYDSKIGGITNGGDTLYYDLGWYSNNFTSQSEETHQKTTILIDAREALLILPRKKGEEIAGVFIQLEGSQKFSMYGKSKNERMVVKIFRSLQFD